MKQICDTCIHKDVCSSEPIIQFCEDYMTIDIQPATHAKWMIGDKHPDMYCSHCKRTFLADCEWLDTLDIPHRFCSNCGAAMDLEDD